MAIQQSDRKVESELVLMQLTRIICARGVRRTLSFSFSFWSCLCRNKFICFVCERNEKRYGDPLTDSEAPHLFAGGNECR